MHFRFLLLAVTLFGFQSFALDRDQQFWGQLTAQGPFARESKWGWFAEYQERYSDDQARVYETFIRPAITYKVDNWGVFSVGYMQRFNHYFKNIEDRPWQQWVYKWQIPAWNFSFRWRQEQRNIHSEPEISHRSRWMARAQYLIPQWGGFSPFVASELMMNWNRTSANLPSGLHQSRNFIGINYQATSNLNFDVSYLLVTTNRSSPKADSAYDTLWFSGNLSL